MTLITSTNSAADPAGNAPFVATERLYLNADGNVVGEDDPDRVELLVGVGGVLPRARAIELGLADDAPAQPSEQLYTMADVERIVNGALSDQTAKSDKDKADALADQAQTLKAVADKDKADALAQQSAKAKADTQKAVDEAVKNALAAQQQSAPPSA